MLVLLLKILILVIFLFIFYFILSYRAKLGTCKDFKYCIELLLNRGYDAAFLLIKPTRSSNKCCLKIIKYITYNSYGIILRFYFFENNQYKNNLIQYCQEKKITFRINKNSKNVQYLEADLKTKFHVASKMTRNFFLNILNLTENTIFVFEFRHLSKSGALIGSIDSEKYFKKKEGGFPKIIFSILIISIVNLLFGILSFFSYISKSIMNLFNKNIKR